MNVRQTEEFRGWMGRLRDQQAKGRMNARIGGIRMTKTTIWDPAEYLDTPEAMAAYLEAALEEDDSALLAAALGDIARAKGMAQIAKDTGLARESLYRSLSQEGNPTLSTVLKIIASLGLKMHIEPIGVTAR